MVVEIDIPRSEPVCPYELLVAGRPLILRVPCQHALQAHAHTLDILHGAPALLSEEIEADDAVGVDVGMYWDGSIGQMDEGDLWGFYEEVARLAPPLRSERGERVRVREI